MLEGRWICLGGHDGTTAWRKADFNRSRGLASHEGFFVVTMARPLAVGPAEFLRFRWIGDKSGKAMTGVLSCGDLNGYYYVLHFVDELRAATRSFPAIRASLKTLAPRGN